MQQEVVLALLAKEPSHGYGLRARLRDALGPLGEGLNAGQIYVTLTRLEKSGLLAFEGAGDRKVYSLTAAGQLVEGPGHQHGPVRPCEVNDRSVTHRGGHVIRVSADRRRS